ncbi:phosphotransferase enzyme family protein [Gorillibacterium sp. sgz500922]|uniref:phosphotransferase enzyme family protein n=1 Tax=Gorillibacterium sp. sgz500922 TaxID=3446694 RepID=UPI003F6786DF
MPNQLTDTGFQEWVKRQWNTPPIQKTESLGESPSRVLRLVFADDSVGFVKRIESEERLERILRIHAALRDHGVRTAELLQAETGHWHAVREGEIYILARELRGVIHSELHPRLAASYGRGLARLHSALLSVDLDSRSPRMDFAQQLRDWAMPGTRQAAERLGLAEECGAFIDIMDSVGIPLMERLPRQWIHRDPHPGNMVYAEDGEVGFLDFDLSVTGIRLFDFGYLCTSQWLAAYSDSRHQEGWLELIRALRQGYEKESVLTSEERAGAFYVLCAIQMIFVAFWQSQRKQDLTIINVQALLELIRLKTKIDDAFGK